jgi:amino acid transporter
MNMAFCFCAILLFFLRSENGGRLSWFYMIGVIATITSLLSGKKVTNDMSITLIIVGFFLYLRLVTQWGIMLSPYKTFLTNGIRENDVIEKIYEYDHNYDIDKFYR